MNPHSFSNLSTTQCFLLLFAIKRTLEMLYIYVWFSIKLWAEIKYYRHSPELVFQLVNKQPSAEAATFYRILLRIMLYCTVQLLNNNFSSAALYWHCLFGKDYCPYSKIPQPSDIISLSHKPHSKKQYKPYTIDYQNLMLKSSHQKQDTEHRTIQIKDLK
jgi:hypothetical protein